MSSGQIVSTQSSFLQGKSKSPGHQQPCRRRRRHHDNDWGSAHLTRVGAVIIFPNFDSLTSSEMTFRTLSLCGSS